MLQQLCSLSILLSSLFSVAVPYSVLPLAPFNSSQVGLLDLAAPKLLPPACKQFNDICDFESSANYEQAFRMYEARYDACGDHGWSLEGHSGGEDSYVAFKTTPCGTRVAVKGSRRNTTIQHIQRECEVLRSLSQDAEVAKFCARCFPKYYYYSEMSRACYSEVVPDSGGNLLRATRTRRPGTLSMTKHVLLQGLTALRMLLKHNVEHRDLTFKNMLIQESDRNASNPSSMLAAERNRSASPDSTFKLRHQYDLTVIDFGASRYYGEEIHRIDAGNQGYSDLHTLCEAFFLKIYGRYDDTGTSSEGQGHTNGNVLSSRNPIPKSHQSLQYVLMLCMQHNSDKTRVLTKQAVAEVELLVSGVSQA